MLEVFEMTVDDVGTDCKKTSVNVRMSPSSFGVAMAIFLRDEDRGFMDALMLAIPRVFSEECERR